MALTLRVALSCLAFLLSLLISFPALAKSQRCLYIIKTKTFWDHRASTNARINVQVYESNGNNFNITDIERYGIMGPYHDYFAEDGIDFFQYIDKCLNPCRIFITGDNRGDSPDWHVDSIDITVTGGLTARTSFSVGFWIAPGFPYTVDYCLPIEQHKA